MSEEKKLEEEKEKHIQLLEERVVVNRSRKKVGEVVIRKVVETKTLNVQVPLKQEKLIVEQIGTNGSQKLAEVDLVREKFTGKIPENTPGIEQKSYSSSGSQYVVAGEFISPSVAKDVLAAIHSGCSKVRVEIVVDNPELQQIYQQIFDSCTN